MGSAGVFAIVDVLVASWLIWSLRSQRRHRELVMATAGLLLASAGFLGYVQLEEPPEAQRKEPLPVTRVVPPAELALAVRN